MSYKDRISFAVVGGAIAAVAVMISGVAVSAIAGGNSQEPVKEKNYTRLTELTGAKNYNKLGESK